MARETFRREFAVAASPTTTWATVTDTDRLVGWISVLEDAQTLASLDRYTAVLADKIGMFSLRADLAITVTDHEPAKRLHATAEGEDRQMGSRIAVEVSMRLDPDGDGTALLVEGAYEVTGRVATLGKSTIHRKADKVLAEFFDHLAQELG